MNDNRYSLRLFGKTFNSVVCDSRAADSSSVFTALVGARSDGHDYAAAAYKNGCRAFVLSREIGLPDDADVMICRDTREALAELSAELYDYPAKKLKIIGITGTKGKSTTASLIYDMLISSGRRAALIGTTGIYICGEYTPTVNTTPESNILHQTFARAVECGCEYLVMEVSSQAFKLSRVHGIDFNVGIFTNLSPDHISDIEHKDYDEYRECKSRLFEASEVSLINADDPECPFMSSHAAGKVLTFGIESDANFKAENISVERTGSRFVLHGKEYTFPLPGRFNISNALAALSAMNVLGFDEDRIAGLLAGVRNVKGRFESVVSPSDRMFIIDYAHNGVSLSFALSTLREYSPKRLVCLFGSIGGRAELRRRELAEVSSAMADFSIITTDNPDFEDPDAITSEIASYMGSAPYIRINDRESAVRYAVANSLPGDIVLFAGKGHEDYQIIEGRHVRFCEREIIEDEVKKL